MIICILYGGSRETLPVCAFGSWILLLVFEVTYGLSHYDKDVSIYNYFMLKEDSSIERPQSWVLCCCDLKFAQNSESIFKPNPDL